MLFIFTFLLQAAAVFALPGPLSVRNKDSHATALYFQTNSVPNNIVSLRVTRAGKVSAGSTFSTGGNGGGAVSATNGQPLAADFLLSQSAVVVAGDVSSTSLFQTMHTNSF
jgi:hypothetical protein